MAKIPPTVTLGLLAITNEARFDLNERVREGIGLAGRGAEHLALTRRDTTQAERRYAQNYHRGDFIQPEKTYPRLGLERGALYEVLENGPGNRLLLRAPDGLHVEVSPANLKKLSVYQPAKLEFAEGDTVRTTRNDAALDVTNGDKFKIVRMDPVSRTITLDDGKRQVVLDSSKPLHLDHAYSMTVHGAQGATADRVFFDADTKPRPLARDVFYVGISRPRIGARVYTDDAGKLPEKIRPDTVKHAALDLERAGADRGGRQRPQEAEARVEVAGGPGKPSPAPEVSRSAGSAPVRSRSDELER